MEKPKYKLDDLLAQCNPDKPVLPILKEWEEIVPVGREILCDTYRVQDGCANCRHVFVRQEHDNDDELYCTFGAPERPPCMSVLMDECGPHSELLSDTAEARRDRWNAWKNGREVVAQGICGNWAIKD